MSKSVEQPYPRNTPVPSSEQSSIDLNRRDRDFRIHFQITCQVPFLAIAERHAYTFEVPLGGTRRIVTLQPADPNDSAHKSPTNPWWCTLVQEFEPPRKVAEFFEGIYEGRIDPEKEWETHGLRGLELLGPPNYRSFVDSVRQRLLDAVARCVSAIQWRYNMRGSHHAVKGDGNLKWSMDGHDWHAMPGIAAGVVATDVVTFLGAKQFPDESLLTLLQSGVERPLGHELLREAVQLRVTSARGAFVVAIMAAEVGLKHCIGRLAPNAEWLIREIQSPPVDKLLGEYLPTLLSNGNLPSDGVPPPKAMIDELKKYVRIRNDIVHKGDHEKVTERVDSAIKIVRNLLYLLDYYCGHQWAWNELDRELRKELEQN